MTEPNSIGGHVLAMRQARIQRRIHAIEAWYDIERTRLLEALDRERRALLEAARQRCEHRMSPWILYHEECAGRWTEAYRRSCEVCGLPEETAERPEHVADERWP